MTVLFADMTSSVATFHGVDPESTTDRVNEVLDAMVASVHAHGGIVDRFLGDGLLALFGTPDAHEDDPVRAVGAALDLCEGVAALGAAATAGVSTGEVYVGQVGSAVHRETTAIGPVVSLAARLQGQARPGEVVIASATARHCAGTFSLHAREFRIKGLPEAVEGFLVTGRKHRPVHRSGAVGSARPMVGRDDELAQLTSATSALGRGEGGVVLIVGEAGLGKSRLLEEAIGRVPGDTVVLEGRCLESGAAPLRPFTDAVHGHLGWGPGTGDPDRRADLDRLVTVASAPGPNRDGNDLLRNGLRAVSGVLGIHDEGWEDLPPQQRQLETFRAVRQLMQGFARGQPVLLVLEDLHWADPASIALTSDLFSLPSVVPLLVICTYRPTRDHPCRGLSADAETRCPERATRIELGELDDRACEAIVAEMLGTGDVPDALWPAVLDRAQGNPLFVEEFVRAGLETGWLVRCGDAWTIESAAAPQVPDTLELIIRARTDRLPTAVRRVLQLASLQGRIFSSAVLAHLEAPEVVAAALESLEERDLAHPARGRRPDEYAFKHVLVQETIERGVLRRVRPDMHRRILDALERIYTDRLDEHAAQLAHHAEQAEDARRAIRHLRAAGLNAKASHLNDEAERLFARAIDWCDRADTTDDRRAELCEHRGDVLHRSGRHGEAIDDYDAALATCTGPLDRARLDRKAGGVAVIQRRYDDALDRFQAAQRELGAVPTEPGRGLTEWMDLHIARAGLHYWRNEPEAIRSALDAIRDDIEEHGSDAQRADALQMELMRRLREERYLVPPSLIAVAERSAELAGHRPDPGFRAFKRFNLAFCRLWARDLHAALEDFDLSIEDGERAGDVVVLSRCHTYRGVAHRLLLDVAACEEATIATEHAARDGEMTEYLAAAQGNRAWLARRRGDADGVRRHAAAAIDGWASTSLVYGFQWVARFPLLAAAFTEGDGATVDEQLEWLRSPSQQRLPAPVEVPLLAGDVPGCIEAATALGYA